MMILVVFTSQLHSVGTKRLLEFFFPRAARKCSSLSFETIHKSLASIVFSLWNFKKKVFSLFIFFALNRLKIPENMVELV